MTHPTPDEGEAGRYDPRPDPTWTARATCATSGVSLEAWHPTTYGAERTTTAKAVCSTCPVLPDCLAFALRTEAGRENRAGIYGATTPSQRRRLAEGRPLARWWLPCTPACRDTHPYGSDAHTLHADRLLGAALAKAGTTHPAYRPPADDDATDDGTTREDIPA